MNTQRGVANKEVSMTKNQLTGIIIILFSILLATTINGGNYISLGGADISSLDLGFIIMGIVGVLIAYK